MPQIYRWVLGVILLGLVILILSSCVSEVLEDSAPADTTVTNVPALVSPTPTEEAGIPAKKVGMQKIR